MLYRKWKIESIIVLDVRSAAHLEAFWMKQDMILLHVSNVLGLCRGVRVRSHASFAKAWIKTCQKYRQIFPTFFPGKKCWERGCNGISQKLCNFHVSFQIIITVLQEKACTVRFASILLVQPHRIFPLNLSETSENFEK